MRRRGGWPGCQRATSPTWYKLTTQMHAAAADLQFELAARRDEIADLKRLRQMVEANR